MAPESSPKPTVASHSGCDAASNLSDLAWSISTWKSIKISPSTSNSDVFLSASKSKYELKMKKPEI